MPNPNKAFSGFDMNFNLLLLFLLALTFIGNYWMLQKGIETGKIYFFMMLGAIGIFGLAQLFIRGDEFSTIKEYMKAPFSTSLSLSVLTFLGGWIIALGLGFLISFSSYSITSFSVPLFGADILKGVTQSFSTVEVSESMAWKIFNISFNAGATEEFVFTFALMLLGVLIGLFVSQIFSLKSKNFVIAFAFVFSTLLFVGAHKLNASYMGIMFIFAGVFKLVSLLGVYWYGLFLTFWIGYHQANNLLYLIQQEGFVNVLNGFVSWFGLFFVAFFFALFWYLIANWDKAWSEFRSYWRG